jgi:CRISPR-associated protein Cas6
MLRDEASGAPEQVAPGDIVDAVFAIACRSLPVDHAYALSQAIEAALPWFAQEPGAGLHTVYGAASASGWMRPEGADAVLQLSHRAKLVLRLPLHRLDDAAALLGRTLHVAGWPMRVDRLSLRPLSSSPPHATSRLSCPPPPASWARSVSTRKQCCAAA